MLILPVKVKFNQEKEPYLLALRLVLEATLGNI